MMSNIDELLKLDLNRSSTFAKAFTLGGINIEAAKEYESISRDHFKLFLEIVNSIDKYENVVFNKSKVRLDIGVNSYVYLKH